MVLYTLNESLELLDQLNPIFTEALDYPIPKGIRQGEMSDDGSGKRWFPLESNPAVMTDYVAKMGFPSSEFSFCDVLSTEDWALEMVPTPVVAVIMLFPIKEHVRALPSPLPRQLHTWRTLS